MNAVGIDVSKGKSTVAVLRPFGEIVVSPFDVSHSPKELSKLVTLLKTLNGDTKVVMEYTGNYYLPIALFLRNNGFFVSVVNPILVKDYSNVIFQFMDKKRSEGKHFYVYMTAAANKFLRIYYARVTEHLNLFTTTTA